MPLLIVLLVSEWHVRVLLLWLAEQFHIVEIYFGDSALGVVAGGVLASAQLALDVKFRAGGDISLNDLDDTSVSYNFVPLGALWNLRAITLGVTFVGCCEAEGCKLGSSCSISDFGCLAHVAK